MKIKSPAVRETDRQPYLLSLEEHQSPITLFVKLFDAYTLRELRIRLRDLLESALADDDCDASSYFSLFRHLENTVEAAHLIMTNSSANSAAGGTPVYEEPLDELYYRPPGIEEIAARRPAEALQKTFEAFNAQELTGEMELWKKCVMTGSSASYQPGGRLEELWNFCDQLLHLIQSADILINGQQPLAKDRLATFFNHFTLTYSRRQLWDWFETVSADDRADTGIDRQHIASVYRGVLSIIVASYHILEYDDSAGTVPTPEKRWS